ncbi:hypothetical protein HPB50_008558 [Hyalomma asiaticum]|uniref:Uncharacterized protein n=1 Tax=Hyalomma asiaticum TaxID=266040 RepID=A0ACB7RU19_HYAAI|nr:hypothetical protein HPB50_008558 [Hyalomma asiaticum]
MKMLLFTIWKTSSETQLETPPTIFHRRKKFANIKWNWSDSKQSVIELNGDIGAPNRFMI